MAEEALEACSQLHVKLVRCDNLIAHNLASKLRAVPQDLKRNGSTGNIIEKQVSACIKNAEKVNGHAMLLHDVRSKQEVLKSDTQNEISINNQDNSKFISSIQIKTEPSISLLKPNSMSKQPPVCNSSRLAGKKKQIPPYLHNSKADRSLPSSVTHASSSLSGKLLNFKLRTNTKLQQTLIELLHLKKDYNSITSTMVQDEVKAMRWKHSLGLYQEPEDSIVMIDSDSNTSDDMWKNLMSNDTDSYANSGSIMKWSWKVIEPEEVLVKHEELSELPEVAEGSSKTVIESQTSSKCKVESFEDANTDDDESFKLTQSEIEKMPPTSESSARKLLSIDGITIEVDPVFPECPLCAEISESLDQLKRHIESFHEKTVTSVVSDNNCPQVSSVKETFLEQNSKINDHNKLVTKGINYENKGNRPQHRATKRIFNALHQLTHYVNAYTNNKKNFVQESSFKQKNISNTLDIGKKTAKVRKKENDVIVLDSDSD